MVWGLFPVDPLPGEESYYFFGKGIYKVGRKGCDIRVNKDKGVSRVHAEILIDEMVGLDAPELRSLEVVSKVRVRDCSKYGTFVTRGQGRKEKVHEFPNKEKALNDGDLVSFGSGNAVYRFSFVPMVFFYCCSKAVKIRKTLQEKILSIGASMAQKWSLKCTHVLVDDPFSLKEELIDAIAAKKPFISLKWVEFVAAKNICTEIPSFSSHAPSLLLEEVSVKVADPQSRESCLNGYTFLLESRDKYKFKERLQSLLEVCGAEIASLEVFCLDSQDVENASTEQIARVIPNGSTTGPLFSHSTKSLPYVNEMDLICSAISGRVDHSIIHFPPALVTSSCSTDETVVADSDAEMETATSVHTSTAVHSLRSSDHEHKEISNLHILDSEEQDDVEETAIQAIESTEINENEGDMIISTNIKQIRDEIPSKNEVVNCSYVGSSQEIKGEIPSKNESINWSNVGSSKSLKSKDGSAVTKAKMDASECENVDVIYSQNLIVRDFVSASTSLGSLANGPVANFKRFRKMGAPSGNSFNNLIPFSNDPYKESDYGNEEVAQMKEEKKRKQVEAMAEEMFNYEGKKRRGVFARS